MKASAFAIDDTQPGSIALQKRLEFCCAMSRPCSEETVDELVEKEVCVCVCASVCVCVCVCGEPGREGICVECTHKL